MINKIFVAGMLGLTALITASFVAPAATVRYAGPVETRSVETIGSTDYYTTRHFATLSDALDSITDASASKPYIITLPPGTYDQGSTPLTTKAYVGIVGSGQAQTTITCSCTSTIIATDNAELRDLTVVNTASSTSGAIYIDATSPRLTRVTATSENGGAGIHIADSSARPIMTDVTINASGGSTSYGLVLAGTNLEMILSSLTINVSGATIVYGVYSGSGAEYTLRDSTVTVAGTGAAVFNTTPGRSTLANVTLSIPSGIANGIRLSGSLTSLFNVTIGGWYSYYALDDPGPNAYIDFDISYLSGGSNMHSSYQPYVGGTMLALRWFDSAAYGCFESYDSSYSEWGATC